MQSENLDPKSGNFCTETMVLAVSQKYTNVQTIQSDIDLSPFFGRIFDWQQIKSISTSM